MLSIVAPAYNNADEVERLLRSLADDFNAGNFLEALIVDDGSRDDSIEKAARVYPFARYVRLLQNSGASAARNEGARRAKGDCILFLDSDVVIMKDTINRVKRHFEDKDAVAVIGRLDMSALNDGFFPRYKSIMFNTWLPRDNYSTVFDSVMGAIRKGVFFECGGFDEAIKGAKIEYARLGFEIRKKYKIIYDPDLVVRVNIKGFKKALVTDFVSTMKWLEVFSEYGQFDNNCTTPGQALGRILGFLSLAGFLFAISTSRLVPWLALFFAYIYVNRTFFSLVLKTEGILFLLKSIPTHMALSSMTVFGGIAGICRIAYKKIRGDRI